MPRLSPPMLRIGIARTGVTVLRSTGWLRRRTEVVCDHASVPAAPDAAALWATLDGIFADGRCAGLPARIILADGHARFFMVTPPRNTSRLQDCRAAAQMRFLALYGENPGDWQLAADWDLHRPFLACALPRLLHGAIVQTCAKYRLVLVEMAPYFIASWNRWSATLKPGAWFAAIQDGTLTLAAIDGQHLAAVRSTAIPTDRRADRQWLCEHVAREALRLNLAVPERLQFCGVLAGDRAAYTDGQLRLEQLDAGERGPDQAASASVALAHAGVRR